MQNVLTPLTRSAKRPSISISFWGCIVPLLAVVLMESVVRLDIVPARLLPAPTDILLTLKELAERDLLQHIGASTVRVLAGFAIGASLAIAVGALVGLHRRAEALLDPSFQALRAIPGLAWVPLLLLWMGIDELPKVTMIAIGAFFPVYLAVHAGIRDVDRKLVEVGEMYGLSGVELVRRIFLPAALPSLFTGLRTGLSLAWMFLVAAELIAATRGLGYLLTDGRETSRPDIVIAAIILLALLGKISDSGLKLLEQRSLAWRDSFGARE
ncbi:ABC transporter permease [Noviherbaspirillum malthae]|uniref:ABC transporter permease n=1 Tax=Noviherbaspirillum malthae TaxID=1260987 RepID=UPI003F695E23